GYGILGIGALHRLLESGDEARTGMQVRFSASPAGGTSRLHVRGTLTAIDPDSISVLADGATHRIARSEVSAMSWYAGREQKWAQGFVSGFVGGGALGAVSGFASGDDAAGDWRFTANEKATI